MSKKKVESFDEEGIFDDRCAVCARRCCCAPPPFRIAIIPVIILLALFIALYLIMFYDATGLCLSSKERQALPPCEPQNVTVGNRTVLQLCPSDPHLCDFIQVAQVSVEAWSLFFIIIIAGFAVIRAIISIIWWIFRAISGKHGLIWAYLKPLDSPIHWLIWNFLFFIAFNRFLFFSTPLVYEVCIALSLVITIACVVVILASIVVVFITRYMSEGARKTEARFRSKAKLVDKVLKGEKKTMTEFLTFGLNKLAKKTIKNSKTTLEAAADGDDVVVEMDNKVPEVTDEELEVVFKKIDTDKDGYINKDDLSKYTEVKGIFAKDLWSIFSSEPKGVIYLPEFIFGIRAVERGLKETISELKNRNFLAGVIRLIVLALFAVIGTIIALDAIKLQLAVLLTALSVMMVAAGMILAGVFGQILAAFMFLLTTKAYYEGDVVVIGGDPIIVKKITLLNTYGFHPDGRWIVYNNAAISQARIVNNSRSMDCTFIFDACVHTSTTEAQLKAWKAAVTGYVNSKPESWKSIMFNLTGVDGVDSKLSVTIAAEIRGANWSRGDLFLPVRADLFNYIRKSANQLGLTYYRTVQPTANATLPTPTNDTEPVTLFKEEDKKEKKEEKEKKEKKEKGKEKDEDEDKPKKKESKKDK